MLRAKWLGFILRVGNPVLWRISLHRHEFESFDWLCESSFKQKNPINYTFWPSFNIILWIFSIFFYDRFNSEVTDRECTKWLKRSAIQTNLRWLEHKLWLYINNLKLVLTDCSHDKPVQAEPLVLLQPKLTPVSKHDNINSPPTYYSIIEL